MRRIILDEPIVFYRKVDGTATALIDRCVHRAYPLSVGALDGDKIVCGYHGFVYDAGGACVLVPGQSTYRAAPRYARFRWSNAVRSCGSGWAIPNAPMRRPCRSCVDSRRRVASHQGPRDDQSALRAARR